MSELSREEVRKIAERMAELEQLKTRTRALTWMIRGLAAILTWLLLMLLFSPTHG